MSLTKSKHKIIETQNTLKIKNLDMNDYNKIYKNIPQGIDKEALDQLCNKLGLDEGGDLAKILNALAEAVEKGENTVYTRIDLSDVIDPDEQCPQWASDALTKEECLSILQINSDEFDRILKCLVPFISIGIGDSSFSLAFSPETDTEPFKYVEYYGKGTSASFGFYISSDEENEYYISFYVHAI